MAGQTIRRDRSSGERRAHGLRHDQRCRQVVRWWPGCAGCWPVVACGSRRSRRRTWRSTRRSPPTVRDRPCPVDPGRRRRRGARGGHEPRAAQAHRRPHQPGGGARAAGRGARRRAEYQAAKHELWPVVLDALADLRRRFDVVICEGAGGAGGDQPPRPRHRQPAAGPRGRPPRGGGGRHRSRWRVRVALRHGGPAPRRPPPCLCGRSSSTASGATPRCSLMPPTCSRRRCGVPTLGIVPMVPGTDLDAEDSLALDRWDTRRPPPTRCSTSPPSGSPHRQLR